MKMICSLAVLICLDVLFIFLVAPHYFDYMWIVSPHFQRKNWARPSISDPNPTGSPHITVYLLLGSWNITGLPTLCNQMKSNSNCLSDNDSKTGFNIDEYCALLPSSKCEQCMYVCLHIQGKLFVWCWQDFTEFAYLGCVCIYLYILSFHFVFNQSKDLYTRIFNFIFYLEINANFSYCHLFNFCLL